MENQKLDSDEIRYKNAKLRVGELKAFYAHLISFVAVNLILIVFNALYHELGYLKIKVNQFYSLIIWGIILLIHASYVFLLGKNWENNKIKKLLNKNK